MTPSPFVKFLERLVCVLSAALMLLCLMCAVALRAEAREGGPFNISPSTWDKETRVLHDAYQVLHAIDCAQTHYIARHPDRYKEVSNAWLLGDHPKRSSVVAWCVMQAYAYSVITQAMVDNNTSPALRRLFHGASIALTVNTVESNYSIGIKWGF
jgi:hypothetical protein